MCDIILQYCIVLSCIVMSCTAQTPFLITSYPSFSHPFKFNWNKTRVKLFTSYSYFFLLGMRWYKGQSVPFMNVFNPDSQVLILNFHLFKRNIIYFDTSQSSIFIISQFSQNLFFNLHKNQITSENLFIFSPLLIFFNVDAPTGPRTYAFQTYANNTWRHQNVKEIKNRMTEGRKKGKNEDINNWNEWEKDLNKELLSHSFILLM